MALGDIDGDGDLDIVVGRSHTTNGGQDIIYVNDGTGHFANPTQFSTVNDQTYAIAIGDLDNDGDLDIVTGNVGAVNQVYINDGHGNFTRTAIGTASENTYSIALGDLDRDGYLDLVVGNYNQANRYYLNPGTGLFSGNGTQFSSTYNTYSVKLGDVDGDGDLDLLAGNYGQNDRLWTNLGFGAWDGIQETTAGTSIAGSYQTYSVQFGDLNNDGFMDIVEANYNQLNKYYMNDGHGNFTEHSLGTDTFNHTSIALGDVNGDGWLDIVAGATGAQYDRVYINQGGLGFAAGVNVPGSNSGTRYSIALGDMDGDGHLDLVEVINDNAPSRIYFNDKMGNFSAPVNLPTNEQYSYSVALGDMDRDGDLDIVVGRSHNTNGGQDIIYFNNGNGTFANPTQFSTINDQTYAIKIGDLNNDGWLDIVTGNNGALNQVYMNNHRSYFTPTAIGTLTENTYSIDLGDLNRDGYLDLVVGNYNQANRYYLNPGTGLFSGNGAQFSSTYNTRSVELGDVDGDGDLDLLAGNYNQTNRLWYNQAWHMTEPGDVRIDVSLMQNPSFEVDDSAQHPGGSSGWTLDSDHYSTFAVVHNKYTINDLAPLFDHDTGKDVLQDSFGLPITVKDETADTTEDVRGAPGVWTECCHAVSGCCNSGERFSHSDGPPLEDVLSKRLHGGR